jgi:hypothetical protein
MKRLLIGSAFVLASSLIGTVTVSAQQEHGSCADFGQSAITIAPGGGLGQLVSQLATTGGPGAVAALVSDEHELFCEPAP